MSQEQEVYRTTGNTHAARQYTYTSFVVRQIVPAPGWQGVCYHAQAGTHVATPLFFLALVRPVLRDCETNTALPTSAVSGPWSAEEDWDVVGLEYVPGGAWDIFNERENSCGLLPPGMPLETFAAGCMRHDHFFRKGEGGKEGTLVVAGLELKPLTPAVSTTARDVNKC